MNQQRIIVVAWCAALVLAVGVQLCEFSKATSDGSASINVATAYADDSIPPRRLRPVQVAEPITTSLLAVGLVSVGLFARTIIKRRNRK